MTYFLYKHKSTILVLLLLFLLYLPQNAASSPPIQIQPLILTTPLSLGGSLSPQHLIYVNNSNTIGPWTGTREHPYQYIQDAIDNATTHATIYILKGVYHETIIVDKPLTIIGENQTGTILDGSYQPKIITLLSDYVTVQNLTIRNSGGYQNNAGIYINSQHNRIINCDIYRTKTAIYLNTTTNNIIQQCTLYTNGEGIYLQSSSNTIIQNTTCTHNGLGINLNNSNHIVITQCTASTNGIGFFLNNSNNCTITYSAAYNNNDNQVGIFLKFCHNIAITNSNFHHNGFGTRIVNSSQIHISQCSFFWNTHFAVKLERAPAGINIINCNIAENLRFGIYSQESTYTIINTNMYHNLLGVYSEDSHCTAQYNWWGSRFGPTFFEQPLREKIHIKQGKTNVFPWLHKKNPNSGSSWSVDTYQTNEKTAPPLSIQLPGQDSDGDQVPDWWEIKYGYDPFVWDDHENLDPDQDGLNNIQECYTDQWGSHPFRKDIFVEFDWMQSRMSGNPCNKPSEKYLDQVKQLFANQGITLHVDVGNLGGGEEIPYRSRFSYADLRDIYWNYFLHNDVNNPRKGIFRYGIVCDYGPGSGFTFIGWDHLDGFCISAQTLQDNQPQFDRDILIVGGSIHELGHTLGIIADDFGGIDNLGTLNFLSRQQLKYLSYRSCMNYFYTYKILGYSDGSRGRNDFNDWENLDFSFFKNTHFEWPKTC